MRGTVLLCLPTRKAVKEIRVAFEGLCDVWGEFRSHASTWPGPRELTVVRVLVAGGDNYPYETTFVLRKNLEYDFAGEVLEAGKHA